MNAIARDVLTAVDHLDGVAIARQLRAAALQGNQGMITRLLAVLLGHEARRSDEAFQLQLGVLEDFSMAMQDIAFTDELTGLFNRRGFLRMAARQLGQARASRHGATVFYLDVDRLKQVNDTYGHAAGDALIQRAARVLRKTFRSRDVIGRLGGDEFAALTLARGPDHAALITARRDSCIREHNAMETDGPALSLSAGSASFDAARPVPIAELLRAADSVMYGRKLSRLLSIETLIGSPQPI